MSKMLHPWCTSLKGSSVSQTFLTNLGSFLEQGHHYRRVSTAHCSVQRTHATVVDMLYHGPMVDQELDLGKKVDTLEKTDFNVTDKIQ